MNPDERITADAIERLANWALEQELPPFGVIAACDRALWWVDQVRARYADDPATATQDYYSTERARESARREAAE